VSLFTNKYTPRIITSNTIIIKQKNPTLTYIVRVVTKPNTLQLHQLTNLCKISKISENFLSLQIQFCNYNLKTNCNQTEEIPTPTLYRAVSFQINHLAKKNCLISVPINQYKDLYTIASKHNHNQQKNSTPIGDKQPVRKPTKRPKKKSRKKSASHNIIQINFSIKSRKTQS
jgi:hypothetical protein